MNQMQNVSVSVAEEDQTIALIREWFGEQINTAAAQFCQSRVEIIHTDGQVPDPGILHLLRRALALRRNDFEHGPIGGANKIVAVVSEIDPEVEFLHVPFGQAARIGRCNRGVFQSKEHKEEL